MDGALSLANLAERPVKIASKETAHTINGEGQIFVASSGDELVFASQNGDFVVKDLSSGSITTVNAGRALVIDERVQDLSIQEVQLGSSGGGASSTGRWLDIWAALALSLPAWPLGQSQPARRELADRRWQPKYQAET